MKAYSLIFGYFCINLAIWTINIAQILAVTRQPIIDPANMTSIFSLDTFTVLTGIVGGGVIGVLAMITKSYALSTGVLILWIMGIVLTPIRDIFVGLPLLIQTVFAEWSLVGSIVSQVVVAFSALLFFVFIVEVILGRDIT